MKNYSIKELTAMFWKSIILIIVLAVIGGGCFGLLAKKKQHTTYTASRNIFITHTLEQFASKNSENSQESVVTSDQDMMESYKDIIEDPQITNAARKTLSKKMQNEISAKEFNRSISAKSRPQSLVLNIKAESSSAEKAVKMVNATAITFKKQLPKIQPGTGKVVVLAKANKQDAISNTTPHAKKYAAVGVALGGLVGLIISFTTITLHDIKNRHQ